MKRLTLLLLCVFCVAVIAACGAKIETYDDVSHYRDYMSFDAQNDDSKWYKWGMDETIWPQTIDDPAAVSDFKMIYYNPWDAQYLGYLVVDYADADYAAEVARLRAYPSTDYVGYYGVQGEADYELLAVYADEYYGFVYALTDGENRIVYAEQIFCNYFMDLDYEKYIPQEYLLDGFDALPDNPYRERMMDGK